MTDNQYFQLLQNRQQPFGNGDSHERMRRLQEEFERLSNNQQWRQSWVTSGTPGRPPVVVPTEPEPKLKSTPKIVDEVPKPRTRDMEIF